MTYSSVSDLSYIDFGRRLTENAGQRRYPHVGTVEVTPYCNLNCVQCYVSGCKYEEPVLSFEEWCHIFDEIAAEGCVWVLITGGEPFLRPDFIDLYAYAKKKGMIITLFTNGTFITREIADFLQEWWPRAVEITLYGATKQTYEAITGVAGSYEKCLRGIELLVERQIPLRLKTVALSINKAEIPAMKQYADNLGVQFRWDAAMMPRIDRSREPTQFRLTAKEIIELEKAFPERFREWEDFCQNHLVAPSGDSLFVCAAGRNSFFIDPFGRLSSCLVARSQSYDLRRGSFREGWLTFLPSVVGQKASPDNICHNCELISLCGCCPGWAELETGDPNNKIEWACHLAHLRAALFKPDEKVLSSHMK